MMKTMIDFEWDPWQKRLLATKGNKAICSGRQVGKSEVISEDAAIYALENPKKIIMVIASTERQALLLFEKILSKLLAKDKNAIMTGKDKPTKHELKLKNKTRIYCLPTGDSGYGIRGYTINRLYADEAAFIKEEVWAAVTPMLATTGGDIVLLSTPFGSEGYFYRCFHDSKFTSFHVSTPEVAKDRTDPQKTSMLNFLDDEKERMTKLQYQQEYEGLFVGGIQRYFPDSLIEMCCKVKKHLPIGNVFQGIDVARMGGDETVLTSVDRINKKKLVQYDLTIPDAQTLTDTARLIIHKDRSMKHKKIYIDDGGLGVGVFDILFEDIQTKRKIVAINNAKRLVDRKEKYKPLLKEFLYANLKNLMEKGNIELLDDPRVLHSLRSIQMDYGDGKLRIYGNYSHIVEALNRAAYCIKDKTLNIYVY